MPFLEPALIAGANDAEPGATVRLAVADCPACGRLTFPAQLRCPSCGEVAQPLELPPDGRLRGFTSVLHAPPGAEVEVPYHVGVAEFAGRIAILGLLDDIEGAELGDVVETVAVAVGDTVTYGFRRPA